MMKKNLVIIAARGIGDLIYHLPLLRSLYQSYKEKLILISNKVNHSKEVYKFENFYNEIIEFDNTRFSFFKTLKTFNNFKKLINSYNADQIILTASSRRLMAPVYFSNAKKKIIFGGRKFLFGKNSTYNNLTHAEKIMKYTEDLNLPILNKNFFLAKNSLNLIDDNDKILKILINLDSHHDQNNWDIKNYIKIILTILPLKVKIFINFSPNKLSFLKFLPNEILNSKNISFTYKKNISEIIEIINSCKIIIGNESGPICLGASLKKEVHSVYLPIHTKPESQIINDKTFYYNADQENNENIINKILEKVINQTKK